MPISNKAYKPSANLKPNTQRMERRYFKYKQPFQLECGGILPEMEICYHISREYPKVTKSVIWITHALTASSDPTDWWDVLVGDGKFFDPRHYTIVCANILGSCYGTTGGTSRNPQTGKPYLLDFPKTTVRDIAICHEMLRKELGIGKIDLLIGSSVGGFQAIEWSILYPNSIRNLVLMACNARITPWGNAFNESQRMALYADQTFGEQAYRETKNTPSPAIGNTAAPHSDTLRLESPHHPPFEILGGKAGLAAARSIALISYRSYSGYNLSQKESDPETLFNHRAQSYQQYQGEKLVKRFDAYSYLSMLNLTDSHNIGRGRGGVEEALKLITARVLCVGIDSDYLFPPAEQQYMAERVRNGTFKSIRSEFGHDGFLLEWKQIEKTLCEWGVEGITPAQNDQIDSPE